MNILPAPSASAQFPVKNQSYKLGTSEAQGIALGERKQDHATHGLVITTLKEQILKKYPKATDYLPHTDVLAVKIKEYPNGYKEAYGIYLGDRSPEMLMNPRKPNPERAKSRSMMTPENLARSQQRAKAKAKEKAIMINPVVLLTFTYRRNELSLDQAYSDFNLMMKYFKRSTGQRFQYVGVAERQKRGAVHLHVLSDKYVNPKVLTHCWQKATKDKSYPDVKQIRPQNRDKMRAIRYVTKYVTKTFSQAGPFDEANKKRYLASRNIEKPATTTIYWDITGGHLDEFQDMLKNEVSKKLFFYDFDNNQIAYFDTDPSPAVRKRIFLKSEAQGIALGERS